MGRSNFLALLVWSILAAPISRLMAWATYRPPSRVTRFRLSPKGKGRVYPPPRRSMLPEVISDARMRLECGGILAAGQMAEREQVIQRRASRRSRGWQVGLMRRDILRSRRVGLEFTRREYVDTIIPIDVRGPSTPPTCGVRCPISGAGRG